MLSLKSGAALIVTLIVAVLAYVVASQFQSNTTLLVILPSVFSVITTLTLYLLTVAIQNKSESAPSSATTTAVKTSASTNDSGIATLYVGNLAYKANEKLVQEYFETVGTVKSVRLVKDKKTGRRKGFGFVEVSQSDESTFINKMNETEFMERSIIVRPANEKQH